MISENLNIGYRITETGFSVKIDSKRYKLVYPGNIWSSFPSKIKRSIIDNFVFLSTFTLPVLLKKKRIIFDFNSPLLASFFIKPVLYYMPACADEYRKDTMSILRKFINSIYDFKSYNLRSYEYLPKVKNKAIILFTFGKDSLLSYAIAEEIGLNPVAANIEDPDFEYYDPTAKKKERTFETKHKTLLIKKFTKEFKKQIFSIKDELGEIKNSGHFGINGVEMPWASQLTEFSLLALPLNHYFKAKYLIYGNEASCSKSYMNKEGLRTNPVFDQSFEWMLELNKMLRLITKKISTLSLIEPIHELAVIKILHQRYPHYAKYQMSCTASMKSARYSRYCHCCSKCARIYIFLKANNIDPMSVGYKKDMLTKDKKKLFSIFGNVKDTPFGYDASGLGRDEMLLAFYLAYKNGTTGYLIDLFKKKFLKKVEKRKKWLMREFFGIHESITLPKYLKKKVLKIYEEELKK
jgi:hypothetical protein